MATNLVLKGIFVCYTHLSLYNSFQLMMNIERHFQRSPVNVMFATPARRRGAEEDKREMSCVKRKPYR